jgi:hypothetical protein
MTYHAAAGAGVATGPVKFVVGALRRLDWTWAQVGDWAVCTYVCICGWCLSVLVGPSVVGRGRDWSPVAPGVF